MRKDSSNVPQITYIARLDDKGIAGGIHLIDAALAKYGKLKKRTKKRKACRK